MLVAGLVVTAPACLALAGITSRRAADAPGLGPFLALMAAAAAWSFAYALEVALPATADKVLWAKLQYPGIVAVPLCWLFFALDHAGHTPRRLRTTTGRSLLAVIPALTLALAATNEHHGWVWASVQAPNQCPGPLIYHYGPWFWVNALYTYALFAIGSGVHGGSIGVRGELGQGSTFWFRLAAPAREMSASPLTMPANGR